MKYEIKDEILVGFKAGKSQTGSEEGEYYGKLSSILPEWLNQTLNGVAFWGFGSNESLETIAFKIINYDKIKFVIIPTQTELTLWKERGDVLTTDRPIEIDTKRNEELKINKDINSHYRYYCAGKMSGWLPLPKHVSVGASKAFVLKDFKLHLDHNCYYCPSKYDRIKKDGIESEYTIGSIETYWFLKRKEGLKNNPRCNTECSRILASANLVYPFVVELK